VVVPWLERCARLNSPTDFLGQDTPSLQFFQFFAIIASRYTPCLYALIERLGLHKSTSVPITAMMAGPLPACWGVVREPDLQSRRYPSSANRKRVKPDSGLTKTPSSIPNLHLPSKAKRRGGLGVAVFTDHHMDPSYSPPSMPIELPLSAELGSQTGITKESQALTPSMAQWELVKFQDGEFPKPRYAPASTCLDYNLGGYQHSRSQQQLSLSLEALGCIQFRSSRLLGGSSTPCEKGQRPPNGDTIYLIARFLYLLESGTFQISRCLCRHSKDGVAGLRQYYVGS